MAIVVSHIADDFATLTRRALRQAPLADLVEIRLDRVGHPGMDALRAFVSACPKPVIVACHGSEAFGTYAGTVEDKLALLRDAATAGARFVDIDWTLSLELGEVQAPCHRIVSRHETEGTPTDIQRLADEVLAVLYEGDVTKVITHARTCEDGLRMLRWLRTTKGIVAFCSGEAGSFTRVLAPIFGSPFTYCAPASIPDPGAGPEAHGAPTAPGQIRVNDMLALLPPGGISQETAILGVIGRPIGHSFSPRVHGMALKAAALDAVYVAFEPETLAGFLALADDENYRGFSVTAPFKEDAFAAASNRDEGSERTGAVNTLLREASAGGKGPPIWRGANTDVSAIRDVLERALQHHGRTKAGPTQLRDANVLVLGAGGAARAAAWAARSLDARVTLAGRTLGRAQRVASAVGAEAIAWDAIGEHSYDVLVHTTPVGSLGGPAAGSAAGPAGAGEAEGSTNGAAASGGLPIPAEWIRPATLVVDAVYRPIRTPLLLAARDRDCTVVPGGEWFVRQAVAQFRLFTHAEPDEDLMRKSFEHALEAD